MICVFASFLINLNQIIGKLILNCRTSIIFVRIMFGYCFCIINPLGTTFA